MAHGSYGAWSVAPIDFRVLRDLVVEVLEHEGYHVQRRRITDRDVKVVGIHGSKLFAHLGQSLPFGALLGIGSRVKATVHCRRSLTEGDPDLRLTVRCAPIEEFDSLEEEYMQSQDCIERVGDNRRAAQCFKRLVQALHASEII